MKNYIIAGIVIVVGIVGYLIGTAGEDSVSHSAEVTRDNSGEQRAERGERVSGRVMSVSDTEIIIGTFAQREGGPGGVDREQIQNMSEEERQAMRALRQTEREEEGEREITGEKIIAITDETTFTKGRGGFGRGQGSARENDDQQPAPEEIALSEITEGVTVMVTLKDGTQEAEIISVQEQR